MANGLFNLKQQLQGLIQKAWAGPQTTPAVEYLVVAGGGGGGNSYIGEAGGGGAGGLLQGIVPISSGSAITVTVGGGGAGGATNYAGGSVGQNSVFGNITANGGGGGAGYSSDNFSSGGSGGGGSQSADAGLSGQGIAGQGNRGGYENKASVNGAGGGGGAGTIGLNSYGNYGGNGGAGIASSISGTLTTYAGGGGGASQAGYIGGAGGVGGGGNGHGTVTSPTAGTANTGGGGGGAGDSVGTPASGGSGIVIISYPDIYNAPSAFGGANSPTASTSGSGSFAPSNTSSWIYYNAPSNLQFGTGDFTIEMWVYLTSTSGTNYLVDFRGTNAPTGSSFGIFQNSSGLQTYSTNLNVNYGMPSANTWYNVVWSRTSGVSYFFVNGTLINTGGTADTTSYTAGTNGPSFGGNVYYSSFGLQGYMSNLRVLKGTGLYTSNFTPSTKPLTAITNTSLLLNTVSGAYLADSSTNANTASVTGAVSWNQLSPFATGLGYKNRVYTWTGSGTVTF
jgi:hypothetical protein